MPIAGWVKWWRKRGKQSKVIREQNTVYSSRLEREVILDFYFPEQQQGESLRLCICQDGQDVLKMALPIIMEEALKNEDPPLLFVGVHANEDRMQEYGTYSRTDYAGRGARCPLYISFVREELVPLLEKRFNVSTKPFHRIVAGFSLGALPAFDLVWHFPTEFGRGGIFSGALWWRSEAFDPDNPDGNRILHEQVANRAISPEVQYWFQAGTEDEKEDRNNNGVIDAIDDTLDLMSVLTKKGLDSNRDICYVEVKGGRHEPTTWEQVMPDFLRWALRDELT